MVCFPVFWGRTQSIAKQIVGLMFVSSEQWPRAPGHLLYVGDGNTTQLYGDYNKPWNKDPFV